MCLSRFNGSQDCSMAAAGAPCSLKTIGTAGPLGETAHISRKGRDGYPVDE